MTKIIANRFMIIVQCLSCLLGVEKTMQLSLVFLFICSKIRTNAKWACFFPSSYMYLNKHLFDTSRYSMKWACFYRPGGPVAPLLGRRCPRQVCGRTAMPLIGLKCQRQACGASARPLVPLCPDRTVMPLTSLKAPRQVRGAHDRSKVPL